MDKVAKKCAIPLTNSLTTVPQNSQLDEKTGRKSQEYISNFWNIMRNKVPLPSVMNALQIGTDSEGGYLVPDEFESTLVESLMEENIF